MTPQPDGGLSELAREEADGRVDGYIQVQLQATRYRDWKAADWEYTYTLANGVPMHALTRYVTIDDTNAYKIIFNDARAQVGRPGRNPQDLLRHLPPDHLTPRPSRHQRGWVGPRPIWTSHRGHMSRRWAWSTSAA